MLMLRPKDPWTPVTVVPHSCVACLRQGTSLLIRYFASVASGRVRSNARAKPCSHVSGVLT